MFCFYCCETCVLHFTYHYHVRKDGGIHMDQEFVLKKIKQMLKQMDAKQLRIIYQFIKALLRKG